MNDLRSKTIKVIFIEGGITKVFRHDSVFRFGKRTVVLNSQDEYRSFVDKCLKAGYNAID